MPLKADGPVYAPGVGVGALAVPLYPPSGSDGKSSERVRLIGKDQFRPLITSPFSSITAKNDVSDD